MNKWLVALRRKIVGFLRLGAPVPAHPLPVPMSSPGSRRLNVFSSEEERILLRVKPEEPQRSLYRLQEAMQQHRDDDDYIE